MRSHVGHCFIPCVIWEPHRWTSGNLCFTGPNGTITPLFCLKDKDEINQSTVTKRPKKFRSGCKNLDEQARSGRSKKWILRPFRAIETNEASSTRKISGELSISQFSMVRHLHELGQKYSDQPEGRYIYIYIYIYIVKSKISDRSRGQLEGPLFDSYYTEV